MFKRLIYSAVVAAAAIAQCSGQNIEGLQDGDLLFCIAQSSNMSDAIVDATKTAQEVQYDHVAIYANINGEPTVIEAAPRTGVVERSLSEFLKDNPGADGAPGVVVMRVTEQMDLAAAVERARQAVGQPYDWSFRPDNGKMYCSELVYESYLDASGDHIFTAAPMNFRNEQGEYPAFWSELFRRNGEEIPQGVAGTNPNTMFAEPVLREIHHRF